MLEVFKTFAPPGQSPDPATGLPEEEIQVVAAPGKAVRSVRIVRRHSEIAARRIRPIGCRHGHRGVRVGARRAVQVRAHDAAAYVHAVAGRIRAIGPRPAARSAAVAKVPSKCHILGDAGRDRRIRGRRCVKEHQQRRDSRCANGLSAEFQCPAPPRACRAGRHEAVGRTRSDACGSSRNRRGLGHGRGKSG